MSDLFVDHVIEVDRSTLERYSECPLRARLLDIHKPPIGEAANIGEEGHVALSKTIHSFIDAGGRPTKREIADELESHLFGSRPDVQPDVVTRFRPSAWAFADYLVRLNAEAILAFDGGEDVGRSGQLAWDVTFGGATFRVTSELDLLHATVSKTVLREVDYKSGWTKYGIDEIAESFQFGMHAVLVFETYPEVEQLEVGVMLTASNRLTPFVTFRRSQLAQLKGRIIAAIGAWAEHEYTDIGKVPAWPSAEKCRLCDVARHCNVSGHAMRDIGADPGLFVDDLAAVQRRAEVMEQLAGAWVKRTGEPIVSERGTRFGPDPKYKPRGAAMKLTCTEVEECSS